MGAALGAAGTSAPVRTWIRTRVASVRPTAPATLDLRAVAIALVAALSVGMLGGASAWIAVATPNTARSYLATSVARWLATNLPAGSTVMFGAVQANETAIVLGGTFRLRSLQATIGVTSPAAPLGVTVGGSPVGDLVVMDRHPREDGYFVFTASRIERSLHVAQPVAIVYVTGLDTATPSMVNWLATAPGITLATTIDSPPGVTPLIARIYRVDMTSLAVPADRTFASSAAVDALLDALGGNARSGAIATALLRRIVMTDPGSAADAAMARLRSLAGG